MAVESAGAGVSLALTLAAAATAAGGWVASLCLPSLGLAAASEAGVSLERLALVPDAAERWLEVAAALVDGVDMLMTGLPGRVEAAGARRLSARARERGAVLMVLEPPGRGWPEGADLRLSVVSQRWEGLGCGHGHLQARQVEVVVAGRRAASRERRGSMWLPGGER